MGIWGKPRFVPLNKQHKEVYGWDLDDIKWAPKPIPLQAQIALGLCPGDEIPLRQPDCFVPNNDNFIMPLRGRNPCKPPEDPEDCCE